MDRRLNFSRFRVSLGLVASLFVAVDLVVSLFGNRYLGLDELHYDHVIFLINAFVINLISWIPALIAVLLKWNYGYVCYGIFMVNWVFCTLILSFYMIGTAIYANVVGKEDPLYLPSIILVVYVFVNLGVLLLAFQEWKDILRSIKETVTWDDILLVRPSTNTQLRLTVGGEAGTTAGQGQFTQGVREVQLVTQTDESGLRQDETGV